MQLDFAPPEGYVEPDYKALKAAEEAKKAEEEKERMIQERKLAKRLAEEQRRFGGAGQRLDGKKKKGAEEITDSVKELVQKQLGSGEFVPFRPGTLIFPRPVGLGPETPKADGEFQAFSGKGEALRKRGSKA